MTLLNDSEDAEHLLPKQVEKRSRRVELGVILLVVAALVLLAYAVITPLVDSDGVTASDGRHFPPPPPYTEYAAVARYLVAVSSWAAMATTSTHVTIEGFPFANVFSISDGPKDAPTGVPYLYLTPLELSVKDLEVSPKASLTMSLAQTDYCRDRQLDPQDPLCAHLILTGQIEKVAPGSPEEALARAALFARHPEMEQWPEGHDWYVARLAVKHIYLLDYFGGAKVVAVEEYFAAQPFGAPVV